MDAGRKLTPLAKPSAGISGAAPKPAPVPAAGSTSGTHALRVLVIDDDRELCWLIKEYLEPLGYEIIAAHNGPDGLERAQAEVFSAVILDVMLPGMDGFDVLKRLRSQSDTPVLMLTARGEETDRIVGLECG